MMGSLGFAWRVCRMLDDAANAASEAEVQRATVLLSPAAWRGGRWVVLVGESGGREAPAAGKGAGSALPPNSTGGAS